MTFSNKSIISLVCIVLLIGTYMVETIESRLPGDDDHNDIKTDENKSTPFGGENEDKRELGYGAIGQGGTNCGPNNEKCKEKKPVNEYSRGCNEATRCRSPGAV
ncbi:hypothetical protein M5689_024786 [Euphorbia peplus]|nr:hypothetical protein M5689_024786 [Euphorbia peplus]